MGFLLPFILVIYSSILYRLIFWQVVGQLTFYSYSTLHVGFKKMEFHHEPVHKDAEAQKNNGLQIDMIQSMCNKSFKDLHAYLDQNNVEYSKKETRDNLQKLCLEYIHGNVRTQSKLTELTQTQTILLYYIILISLYKYTKTSRSQAKTRR